MFATDHEQNRIYGLNILIFVLFLALRIAFAVDCYRPGGLLVTVGTVMTHPVSDTAAYLLLVSLMTDGLLFIVYGVLLVRLLYKAKKPDFVLTLLVTITLGIAYFIAVLHVVLPYLTSNEALLAGYVTIFVVPMELMTLVVTALVVKYVVMEGSARQLQTPLLNSARISGSSDADESDGPTQSIPKIYEI